MIIFTITTINLSVVGSGPMWDPVHVKAKDYKACDKKAAILIFSRSKNYKKNWPG